MICLLLCIIINSNKLTQISLLNKIKFTVEVSYVFPFVLYPLNCFRALFCSILIASVFVCNRMISYSWRVS